jgi:hypothetical protein
VQWNCALAVLLLAPAITPAVLMMNDMSPAQDGRHQSQFMATLLLYAYLYVTTDKRYNFSLLSETLLNFFSIMFSHF